MRAPARVLYQQVCFGIAAWRSITLPVCCECLHRRPRPARNKQAGLRVFAVSRWFGGHSKPHDAFQSSPASRTDAASTSFTSFTSFTRSLTRGLQQPARSRCCISALCFPVTWQLKASTDPFTLGDLRSANLCFAAGFDLSNALRSKEAPTRRATLSFCLCTCSTQV